MSQNAAVILAAGSGTRAMQKLPKQFVELDGKPMLLWSVEAFLNHKAINKIIVVTHPDYVEKIKSALSTKDGLDVIAGGEERSDSVRAALLYLKADNPEHVFIHDAARPGLDSNSIDQLLDALQEFDGVAPALKMSDALKLQTDQGLKDVNREGMFRVQTPQAFKYGKIFAALNANTNSFVDDLAAAQSLGMNVGLVEGSNFLSKVTYPEDFDMMEALFRRSKLHFPRVGMGYDVHAFEPGSFVTLCGIEVPHTAKLKGHSDADVAWHALADAIYGALAEGDIGRHFPPTDPQWSGAPSSIFLSHAAELVHREGYFISNLDITLICEAPKIKPHATAMCQSTADVLGIDVSAISIKATTTETLGFTGRKEGIACQAIVMLAPFYK